MADAFLKLFDAYGIELEYMIVDEKSLKALPITDQVFKDVAGHLVSDIDDGRLEWSNELVMHVVELKVAKPVHDLKNMSDEFARGVQRLNSYLKKYSAKLMPTAMHPFMIPDKETQLWPHDNNEVYSAYNRIFDCKGHGWSNVQSTHINLPFADDSEFAKLHAAIRIILPLVPALAASSPIHDGQVREHLDSRLEFYKSNQIKVPSIAGDIIPESVKSIQDYKEKILAKIYKEIAPYDTDQILQNDWLNSRGAIARLERQSIEIRLMDIQEAPIADFAIIEFLVHLLKILCTEKLISLENQQAVPTKLLKACLDANIRDAEKSRNHISEYANIWGCQEAATSQDLLQFLYHKTEFAKYATDPRIDQHFKLILQKGSLASRMKAFLMTHDMPELYQKLSQCLASNQSFAG